MTCRGPGNTQRAVAVPFHSSFVSLLLPHPAVPFSAVTKKMSPLSCCQAIGPDHIVLRCSDPVASVLWYQNTLGLQPVRLEEFKAGKVPFPSVRVSPTFLIGETGMFCVNAAAPAARSAHFLCRCAMHADFFKQQEDGPPEAAHLPAAGSTARRNTGG